MFDRRTAGVKRLQSGHLMVDARLKRNSRCGLSQRPPARAGEHVIYNRLIARMVKEGS
jgi:hypothetical protein